MAAARRQHGRRIGDIFVGKGLITEGQLAVALEEQERTGQLLGEICVARFGVDRLRLADVLAAQWDEIEPPPGGPVADDPVRALLDDTRAAGEQLRRVTQRMDRRLAALEGSVAGIAEALAELRALVAPPAAPRRATRSKAGATARGATGTRAARRSAA
jgi:hypothetical protein